MYGHSLQKLVCSSSVPGSAIELQRHVVAPRLMKLELLHLTDVLLVEPTEAYKTYSARTDLSSLTSLKTLKLCRAGFRPAADIHQLSCCTALEVLEIKQDVGQPGGVEICRDTAAWQRTLGQLTKLKELSLKVPTGHNGMLPARAPALQRLSLHFGGYTRQPIIQLLPSCNALTRLELCDLLQCTLRGGNGDSLSGLVHIRVVRVERVQGVQAGLLVSLPTIQMEQVVIVGRELGEFVVTGVAQVSSVLQWVGNMPGLKLLDLAFGSCAAPAAYSAITASTVLTRLSLYGSKLPMLHAAPHMFPAQQGSRPPPHSKGSYAATKYFPVAQCIDMHTPVLGSWSPSLSIR